MAFTVHAVMPGVWHIVDCMGVCMTLLEGENAAMLVDTGYGIEDVADFMRHMTDLPLTVFLTHNHHDHAMGARCFPETYMLEADIADWRMFTNDEMRRRVLTQAIGKNLPVDEVLLVLDATTGQNGMAQAKVFAEAIGITGVVLSKLDGSAKGGIVISVQKELGVPVKLVGLGEGPDDLAPFDPEGFVDGILA